MNNTRTLGRNAAAVSAHFRKADFFHHRAETRSKITSRDFLDDAMDDMDLHRENFYSDEDFDWDN